MSSTHQSNTEISLDDDTSLACDRVQLDPGAAWCLTYHEDTPQGIGGRKGMIDRQAVLHDADGEHPPAVIDRASFVQFAAIFPFSPSDLEIAIGAWEQAFYRLDRVKPL